MTPIEYYQQQVRQSLILEDQQQFLALQLLQKFYDLIIHENNYLTRLYRVLCKSNYQRGLYLWGGVGIGKTFLMDCFYNCLPLTKKRRLHFHQFMKWIQNELKLKQGMQDPLITIAKELSKSVKVLCLDELIVTDIVDAMILGRLLDALFSQGVWLICTSNSQPDDLYKRGLQRDSFLPTITMLKKNMQIVHIPTTVDYRLRHLQNAGVFYTPNDEIAEENMQKVFSLLADSNDISEEGIELYGRYIPVKMRTENIIWFDFAKICMPPRSQLDYLEIAKHYRTVLISDIPVISAHEKDTIALFIRLVDVLYDARVRIAFSAEQSPEALYTRGNMLAEYKRTYSRLYEMQSQHYFEVVAKL